MGYFGVDECSDVVMVMRSDLVCYFIQFYPYFCVVLTQPYEVPIRETRHFHGGYS